MNFIEKLTQEFQCAVKAMCDTGKANQELEQGAKLSEVLPEQDLDAIVRKMKFYIYG